MARGWAALLLLGCQVYSCVMPDGLVVRLDGYDWGRETVLITEWVVSLGRRPSGTRGDAQMPTPPRSGVSGAHNAGWSAPSTDRRREPESAAAGAGSVSTGTSRHGRRSQIPCQ